MITEKPVWVKHERLQIFSIDVQPNGERFATGGGDHKVRIWNMKSVDTDLKNLYPKERLLATIRDHFGSVNCVRWAKHGRSPEGYSLFACSLDGTVAMVHFDPKELGVRLTDSELDELKKSSYGDVRGRQANLLESPAQLLLETVVTKPTCSKRRVSDVQQNQVTTKPFTNVESTAKKHKSQANDRNKTAKATCDTLIKASTLNRVSNHVNQKVYRRPDGRKRIIPEAVGVPQQETNVAVNDKPIIFLVNSNVKLSFQC